MVGQQFPPGVGDTADGGTQVGGAGSHGTAIHGTAIHDTAPIQRIPPPAGRSGAVLKGAGLLAVAVVSGLVWWLIRHDAADSGQAAPAGQSAPSAAQFQYAPASEPVETTDCAANSYGEIQGWFGQHPCQSLSRALYVTETGGTRALVSVAVVTMPAPELAQQFKAITDTDKTGNVTDLVRDGTATIPGAPTVANGEYQSQVNGTTVTIVETNFFDGRRDDALLPRIATDALLLGDQLR